MQTKITCTKALMAAIISLSLNLNAQVFQKVGTGINAGSSVSGQVSHSHTTGVYFGYTSTSYTPQRTYKGFLVKWDGLQWVQYPQLPHGYISGIAVYQGNVYASGYDWSIGSNVFRFDGSNWVPIFNTLNGIVFDLTVHNGLLVCAGGLQETTTGNHGIVGYDGTDPVSIIPGLSYGDTVVDVNVINNELWVTGTLANTGDSAQVKRLNNNKWSRPAHAHKPAYTTYQGGAIFEYNSKIYVSEGNKISEITNDTAYSVTSGYVQDYAEHNGMMFLTTWSGLQLFDGTSLSPVANAPQQTRCITSQGNGLYGFFNDTIYGSDKGYNHVFKSSSQYGILSGHTFVDNNGNCTYDPGVDEANRMFVKAQGTDPVHIWSDYTGEYQIALAPGTYNLSPVAAYSRMNKYLVPACSNASGITVAANQSYQEDFAVEHDGTIDLETSFHPYIRNRARQGFTEGYTLKVKNPGAAITQPFDIKITVPSSITLVSTTPQAASVNGNTYTFNFPGIAEREEESIGMMLKIDLNSNTRGDTLRFYSDISGVSNDAVPASDKDTLVQLVVGACDPNDKTAGVERSLPGLDVLDYHIRFQNVGTDTAYNVVIVDTLESYFDPAAIMIHDASHPYSFTTVDENILVWTFENILLPDSGASQMGSRGYVDFSINVDPNLAVGDTIDNDAEIYFDYQPPVHTNHAKTAIVQWMGTVESPKAERLLEVFPNPAEEVVNLWNKNTDQQILKLYNTNGRLMDTMKIEADEVLRYNLKNLPAGMYLIHSDSGTLRVIVK